MQPGGLGAPVPNGPTPTLVRCRRGDGQVHRGAAGREQALLYRNCRLQDGFQCYGRPDSPSGVKTLPSCDYLSKIVHTYWWKIVEGYESLMILFPIVSFHEICDGFKFHASGREDINVRMLNLDLVNGHPFLIEVLIARSIPYASEVEQNAEKIKIAPKRNISELLDSEIWSMIHEGEAKPF
ncbi:hypothetical protein BRADI_3g10850v3 [Brachypodium distachyon]|uniref:tRNA pseudouridine(55) synthase n=1 Tax=Brachypodium distachyon TaxID=15368 RepID=I1HZQ7_BRADI|nr:hypothetical protein BRADI_3g10850v3 [Brachypodium distachyon]